jgi:hypothetical protein
MTIASEMVSQMQLKIGSQEAYGKMRQFMVAYLASVGDNLPQVVLKGMEVATRFNEGAATSEELEGARVACWKIVDSESENTDFQAADRCVVRAAICFLYASPPDDDLPEVIDWFLALANNARGHPADIQLLLRTHFGYEGEQIRDS